MRQGLIWVVLLIAVVAVGWMLFGGGMGGSSDYDDGLGGVDEPGDETNLRGADEAPALKGAGPGTSDRPYVPSEIRGRGMIQGIARRGGNALAATVELRHIQEIDPRDPFKGGMETHFIARILDAGMSTKEVIARVLAGADGIFKFRGLATGLYEVRATAEDGAVGFASASLPAKGARVEASVDIPDGDQALSGRVAYADGTPFRGLVLATEGDMTAMMMGGGAKSQPAQTDAEGRFKLAGLRPGIYLVSAMIPGVMRVMGSPVTIPATGEYVLTINASGVAIKGKVIDGETEAAIGGALVFGGGGNPSSGISVFSTKSDANGEFTMTLPASRGGGMFVRAEGYAGQTVDLEGGVDGETLTISLLRLAKLTGRVTAEQGGGPVAGISVFAMASRRRGMMPSPGTAITDADGRYTMEGVDPGALKVHAIGAGYASVGMSGPAFGGTTTPYAVELEPGQEGTLDLKAVASGSVSGRVLTEAGAPVPGAVVEALGGGMSGQMAMLMGMNSGWGTAVTDADGAYTIDVLVPGTEYTVVAKAPNHPDTHSSKFEAVGGQAETIDLRMKAPRWLDALITDADSGKPVSGARIVAVSATSKGMGSFEMFGGVAGWNTDAVGRARIGPLPDGDLMIYVTAAGYIKSTDTEVAEDATLTTVRVKLKRGLVIAGRLQMPEGIPAQQVQVTVRKQDASNGWYHNQPPVQPDGTWRVDDLEDTGEYVISARGQWKDTELKGETRADAGDERVVLTLLVSETEKRASLVIMVLDHEGKPVPAGRVQLWGFQDANNVTTSRARLSTGRAVVRGFDTSAEIWVEVAELVGSKRGATIQGPVTLVGGKLEIRLGRPLSIGGSVTGDDGKPVAGVKVTATAVHPRPGTNRSGREHGSAVSDTDGRFKVKGLGALEYTLTFKGPPDYTSVPSQKVRAGTSGIAVRMKTGLRATVTVFDYEGKPVVGAWVTAQRSERKSGGGGWNSTQNRTGGDGTLTLRGLEPNVDYDLNVNQSDRSDLKSYRQEKWRPVDITITMKRALLITGTVVDQFGKPAAGVTIRSRKVGTESWSGWARTAKDGSFTVKDLEAGRYEVKAQGRGVMTVAQPMQPGQPPAPEPNVVKARAGATGVKITIDRGLALTVTIRGATASPNQRRAVLRAAAGGTAVQGTWKDSRTVVFQGIVEDAKYKLWISGLDDGKFVLVDNVVGESGRLSVNAEAGGVIEGAVRLPAGVTFRYLNAAARNVSGMDVSAQVDLKTGAFRLEGLPHEGAWTLYVSGMATDRTQWHATGSASTGANVSLELKARPKK